MSTIILFLAFTLVGSPAHSAIPSASAVRDRIRPLDRTSEQLVADGLRRSPTIASLIDHLVHSTVIVYVSAAGDLRIPGALTFMAHSDGVTYVLVRVQPMLVPDERLAALGHELQHAREIADAGDSVENDPTLAALYKKIGFQAGRDAFESPGARATEALVRRELSSAAAAR